jgi:hypothetical protein
MVKTNNPHTTRAFRKQTRELVKIKRELDKTTLTSFVAKTKMKALGLRLIKHHNVILTENNILRQSLKNFQKSYYKLKKKNQCLVRGIRLIQHDNTPSHVQKRHGLKTKHQKTFNA